MSKSQTRASNKYNAKAYDRLAIQVKKGRKAEIQAAAEKQGESLNAYVVNAVEQRMKTEQETVNDRKGLPMDKIFSYIDDHAEEMISDLRRLVRIPSVMGEAAAGAPFGEMPARALDEMLGMCSEAGLHVRNIDGYVGTADLYPAEETPELGILCHLDVVPEGSGWSVPPYDLTERDGKLFGRGAIDDKGPAAAVLWAVKALKASGVRPEKNLRLIFGTNEENGSADLAYYRKMEKLPEMLFTPDGSYPIINAEKGMLRVSYRFKANAAVLSLNGGNAVNAVPEYAEAVLDMCADVSPYVGKFDGVTISSEISDGKTKITAKGMGAHASTPENGANAVTALISIVSEICGDPALAALSKMFPYGETDGAAAGIKCSDEISGGLTTVLSVISCSEGVIEAKQDVRFPVEKTSGDILPRLAEKASAAGLELNADMISEPHHVPENSTLIKKLLEVYERVTGEKGRCIAIGGGTYVHETENGVAFGAEFPGEENNMHGADEFIDRESLIKNAKIFAAAICSLCGTE